MQYNKPSANETKRVAIAALMATINDIDIANDTANAVNDHNTTISADWSFSEYLEITATANAVTTALSKADKSSTEDVRSSLITISIPRDVKSVRVCLAALQ